MKTKHLFLSTIISASLVGSMRAQIPSNNIKILFCATEGQSSGNSDWVVDADTDNIAYTGPGGLPVRSGSSSNGWHSNAQRFPTPAQSGVSSTTTESYWTGSSSHWAIDMAKMGYQIESLPTFDSITYGNSSHAQDLSNYKVFIIDEPQFPFSTRVKTALMHFVQNGGGLFMVSDHNVSSRTNNGWDSPHVWNDFILNNPIKDTAFGFVYDLVNISPTSAAVNPSPTDSIIVGPMGTCPGMEWHNGTTITMYPSVNPSVTGDVFQTAVGNTGVMFGHGRYGAGKFAFEGDSSPTDDGTGNPNSHLYPDFAGDPNDEEEIIIVNATIWLATSPASTTGIKNISANPIKFELYPNPASSVCKVKYILDEPGNVSIRVFDVNGNLVKEVQSVDMPQGLQIRTFDCSELSCGVYSCQIQSKNLTQTQKLFITR
ncbi:MAG: T9SS type A sorting domain-containing protein [Bacteroidetes bacterium]|nr:T9SS type A sorting domain-containing protein [Bacteroidota bacterium]